MTEQDRRTADLVVERLRHAADGGQITDLAQLEDLLEYGLSIVRTALAESISAAARDPRDD